VVTKFKSASFRKTKKFGTAHIALAISSAGNLIACEADDNGDRVQQPSFIAELPLPPSDGFNYEAYNVAFSADGRMVAATWGRKVLVWELISRKLRITLDSCEPFTGVTAMALTADCKGLATVSETKGVIFWDLATGKQRFAIKWSDLSSVRVLPDSKILAAGDDKGVVKLWETATGKEVATLDAKDKAFCVQAIAFSPDCSTLAIAGGSGRSPPGFWGEMHLWDLGTNKLRCILGKMNEPLTYAAFSPNGQTFIGGSLWASIKMWHVSTGKLTNTWRSGLESTHRVLFCTF
jgi:WD40 repeat protein